MITANFFREDDSLTGFHLHGHSGYAEEGSDIVCAAVSSASQFVCNTISDHFHDSARIYVKDNTLEIRLDKHCDGHSFALIQSFFEHLQMIEEEFPGTIRICINRCEISHGQEWREML
ncbi:MAG: ribosomal-processing cysteine protease Prp [Oscillospiraceae bacterium]|nr:ribosomal-processing cysteine protease Prp [Oscillospiraceae bacterium]